MRAMLDLEGTTTNQLSTDLVVITEEIRGYQRQAGKSIWEIGKRIAQVKNNDLAHGQFLPWLESIGMNVSVAERFMKIATTLEESDKFQSLGYQALYLITTLPEDERHQEHELASGVVKEPSDMTVRELQEVKRKLKAAESNNQQLQAEIDGRPEKVVEKAPADYEDLKEIAQYANQREKNLNNRIGDLKKQLEAAEADSANARELQRQIDNLGNTKRKEEAKIIAIRDFAELKTKVEALLEMVAPVVFSADLAQFSANDPVIENLSQTIGQIEQWTSEMRELMPSGDFVEGVIVDG